MLTTVSAYEARKRFGELLNIVAFGKKKIIVERRGVPLVEIKPIIKTKKTSSYFGVWSGEKGKIIEKAIADFRRKSKPIQTITL